MIIFNFKNQGHNAQYVLYGEQSLPVWGQADWHQ